MSFVEHNDVVLGRWAAVMLNADVYAEVIDRHVELAGDLAWLSSVLGFELSEDDAPTRQGRSHPAALVEGPLEDEQLAQRLAAITQLAEQLDRGTLALALRIVPIAWWREQLGASTTDPLGAAPPDAVGASRVSASGRGDDDIIRVFPTTARRPAPSSTSGSPPRAALCAAAASGAERAR